MEKRDLGKGKEMFMAAPPTYGQVMKEAGLVPDEVGWELEGIDQSFL
jgi:hypothetical protein